MSDESKRPLNCIVRVEYKEGDYAISVETNDGAIVAKGPIYDSQVQKTLKQFQPEPEWYIHKANETFVYNIMNGEIEARDWNWSCIIEAGYIEDWSDCHNFEK